MSRKCSFISSKRKIWREYGTLYPVPKIFDTAAPMCRLTEQGIGRTAHVPTVPKNPMNGGPTTDSRSESAESPYRELHLLNIEQYENQVAWSRLDIPRFSLCLIKIAVNVLARQLMLAKLNLDNQHQNFGNDTGTIATKVSQAVFFLLTTLQFHKLTTQLRVKSGSPCFGVATRPASTTRLSRWCSSKVKPTRQGLRKSNATASGCGYTAWARPWRIASSIATRLGWMWRWRR